MGAFALHVPREGPADPRVVHRMLAAAPHRGRRVQVEAIGGCVLGVSNVGDRTDAWLAVDEGMAALVVGRIDNLAELGKRVLEHEPRLGATPAEVVLALFRSVGESAPTSMRGVYAVAVTDGRWTWFFRDHAAFAQLLYRHDDRGLYVATEAKQVVAGARIPREPDVDTVEGWFFGEVPEGDTPCALKGVWRPAKATMFASDGRRLRRRRYWDPDALFETGRYGAAELQERFDGLVAQAVERTMTGNDIVSLSGGIDSPTVAAYGFERHREIGGRPLAALSFVFPRFPEVDEAPYIRIAAERFGLELHTMEPQARPLDDIVRWTRLSDSPCPIHPPAEAAEYYRTVRELGYENIIGGELAEFLTAQRAALLSHLVSRGRFRAIPPVVRSQRDIDISWRGIARQFAYAFIPRAALAARLRGGRVDPDAGFPAWLDERRVSDANAQNLVAPMRRYRWEQTGFFIGPPIGTESDATVQAVHGVLNRRPWVDVDLSEFFVSLRAEIKYPDFRFKTLVKRLLRGRVPDEILDRTDKTYFNQRILGTVDWDALRRWVVDPTGYRVPGVDYGLLAERIERRDFKIGDLKWAVDLAKTHAFMSEWE